MRLIRLILILSLLLTGHALASARGQAQIGERLVLCTGHAVVVVYGPDGAPVESPYYCPDMALAAGRPVRRRRHGRSCTAHPVGEFRPPRPARPARSARSGAGP